jgi:hypothetical protein
MEFHPVQWPGYCHWVRGFLWNCAIAVSTVVDVAGGFVDGWLVAPADRHG